MATGWAKVNGSWYYLNANGAMATGWLQYNDSWYYLNA
ncbi:choline-binding protein, partial [Streptococcus pneumoniae]